MLEGFERRAASSGCGNVNASFFCLFQVQDLEFVQIEKKVIDGLKVGNECLKKMHEVRDVHIIMVSLSLVIDGLAVFLRVR